MLTALSTFSSFSVDDIEEAKEFYIQTLDMKLVDDSMGLELELPGGGKVFIYEKNDHQPAAFTVLNFEVEDIDQTIAHMSDHHGIEFEIYDNLPAKQDEQGVLRGRSAGQGPDIAWFKDPADNILSIVQN